jgi:hypothetical protein
VLVTEPATGPLQVVPVSNPLSLKTLTDTLTVNGHAYTSVFDAAAGTITATSPANRQSVTTVDSQGRVVEEQVAGIDPLFFTYDSKGWS